MSFHPITNTQHAIAELQSKATVVVNGAAVDTNIAVSGIAVGDTIVSVIRFVAGVPSIVTSEASITSAGNIQLDTTDTTGDKLVVEWCQHKAYR